MLDAGVFDDIDISLSSHPKSNRTTVRTDWPLDASASLAMIGFRYAFHGRAAHAAMAPHTGINALNAVIALFNGIDAMRQHLVDDVRIHGVITDGGSAPNVVPAFAAANFMLRARDGLYLQDVVVDRVRKMAEGAALMTGSQLEVESFYPFYDNVRPNSTIATRTEQNAHSMGDAPGRTRHRTGYLGLHRFRKRQPDHAVLRHGLRGERGAGGAAHRSTCKRSRSPSWPTGTPFAPPRCWPLRRAIYWQILSS